MAVVIKTYGEQLQEVQEAITAVMTAQRHEYNGKMLQRADLEWLHRREMFLIDMIEKYGENARVSKMHNARGAIKVRFE